MTHRVSAVVKWQFIHTDNKDDLPTLTYRAVTHSSDYFSVYQVLAPFKLYCSESWGLKVILEMRYAMQGLIELKPIKEQNRITLDMKMRFYDLNGVYPEIQR